MTGMLKGCGKEKLFTLPVVRPSTISRTNMVKSRHIIGVTIWQRFEQ